MDVERIRLKYRRNARLYDFLKGPTARLRGIAVERLSLRPGEAVLDFGCGTGLSFEPLEAAVGPGGRLIGVDVSPDMLARAREKVSSRGWTNVTLIEANVEEAALPPESVDAVLCFYTHDITRSERALAVAVGALRTCGRFVAAGVKRARGALGLVLNPITVAYSLPAVTNLSGLDRPWELLERLLGRLEVEEHLAGTTYVARGVKLSIEGLARHTGEPAERLREWRALGLVSDPRTEGFTQEDVERVRLVRLLLRRGIALEAIVAWAKAGELDRHVALLAARGSGVAVSLPEAAERTGLDPAVAERVWDALGFAERTDVLTDEDVQALGMIKSALEAGFQAEALEQIARVSADALGRIADTQARLFHFQIRRGLQTCGLTGAAHTEGVRAATEALVPLIEPLVLYCHRKALQAAIREDAVLELAEQTGLVGKPEAPEQIPVAVVFVDISSFTALAEAMGDVKAAEVLDRFSALVRQAVRRREGRVAKQIGDAFMLVFPHPAEAVACALEIEAQAAAEPQFPAVRSGVHWGPVLYREGDYVGTNVNIAARLATEAGRHQVLVSGPVRHEAAGLPDVEFIQLPKRQLKGLVDDVELFEARSRRDDARRRLVDPVCGMELYPVEVTVRLSLEGNELAFCSEECLRRYVAAPTQYARS